MYFGRGPFLTSRSLPGHSAIQWWLSEPLHRQGGQYVANTRQWHTRPRRHEHHGRWGRDAGRLERPHHPAPGQNRRWPCRSGAHHRSPGSVLNGCATGGPHERVQHPGGGPGLGMHRAGEQQKKQASISSFETAHWRLSGRNRQSRHCLLRLIDAMEHATELQAALHTIHLRSPDPLAMARFYSRAYGMSLDAVAGGYACCGPGRSVQISRGPVKQLGFAQFMLHSDAAWQALRQRVRAPAQAPLPAHCAAGGAGGAGAAVAWRDPDGNLIVFTAPGGGAAPGPDAGLPAAMLQHFALRTPQLPQMLAFYTGQLGLVLMACFDPLSFEVPDWACMKTGGDHMARLREPIVWGLGRHGPGNDVFFMVRDPDGNLVEISSEIEHCEPGRAVGEWPHEERTLNRWGPAISRG